MNQNIKIILQLIKIHVYICTVIKKEKKCQSKKSEANPFL